MPADSEREAEGLSRRQVLARGAVAAGVVWAAPVIRTATAYATSSAGTERPCINFYLVAIDALGVRPVRFAANSRFGYDDIPNEVAAAMAAATTTTTSSTTTTSTSTTTTTTTPPAPAGPAHASKRPATTTSSSTTTTTSTTRPPLHDPADGESASKPATTPTTKPRKHRPPTTTSTSTTTTTTAPAPAVAPTPAGTGAPVDDFGLFTDPSAPPLNSPAAAVPTNPADPHSVLFAAAAADAQAAAPDSLPPGITDWLESNPDVPVRYPTSPPMVTQTGDDAWAIVLQAVGGPDPLTHQCRAVNGWAVSKGKRAEYFVDPDPPDSGEAGRRIIFPNPRADDLTSDPSALIERVFFVFCCPQ